MTRFVLLLVVASLACPILLGGCDHTVKVKTDEATRKSLEKSTENIEKASKELDPLKTGRLLDEIEERDKIIEELQTKLDAANASAAAQRDEYSVVIRPKEYILTYELVKGDGYLKSNDTKVTASVDVEYSDTEVTLRTVSNFYERTRTGWEIVGTAKDEDSIWKAQNGYRIVKVENNSGRAQVQHDQSSRSSQLNTQPKQVEGCVSGMFSQVSTGGRDLPTIDPEKQRSAAERKQAMRDAMGNEGRVYSKLTTSGIVVYLERVR